jgi:hypothetical protein
VHKKLITSLLTSSWLPAKIRNNVAPSAKLNSADIKIAIPCLLLCFELAIIAVLHLFSFPAAPYFHAVMHDPDPGWDDPGLNPGRINQGGFLGFRAILDALNFWDIVKGFARSIRWLLVGLRDRENDLSYRGPSLNIATESKDLDLSYETSHGRPSAYYSGLPIADEFRMSKFGLPRADAAIE